MPNRFGLNRSLGGAIAVIAIVSLASSAAVRATLTQLQDAAAARGHSSDIIRSTDAFLTAMLNQETGLRGYLLTGRESSLEPYHTSQSSLDQVITHLHELVQANPGQAARVTEAEVAARAWQINVGEAAIRAMADSATRQDAIRVESAGVGKHYFDAFREKISAIQAEEQRIFPAHNRMLARAASDANAALWIGSILTLLICAAVGIAINRRIVRPLIQLAGTMNRLTDQELETNVPGTHYRNEVGAMARAVEVFKSKLIELDQTSLLRTTADTLPAMVGYVDAEHRVGFLNGEFGRWFDLPAEDVSELYGRPLTQVFAEGTFPGLGLQLETALAGAESRFEHRFVRRGSGWRILEAYYRPHRAPSGAVLGVVTLLIDITDRKRMERRLAKQTKDLLRSNEELEQFAYVASHDLKAPLRGIENLVSWIEEDLEGSLTGEVRTNMDLLKSRVRRLESLLDDLLTYSRAGRSEAVIDMVDTRALVAELAILVSPPDGFFIKGDDSLPTIQTARAPLTQTLQNLIGNAIKHHDHPTDGHIRVAASSSGTMTEFIVLDDGPGIPDQFRERVFGMFQTLRPRDEVEGSGMGLAIVKKLVERQGGAIWLTGRTDSRGLAVHFTWPNGPGEHADGSDREFVVG